MKKFLLTSFFAVCFIAVFSQANFSGALAVTDAMFHRPAEGTPPTILSTAGTSVHFDVITLNIPIAGVVTVSTNSIWDNFTILYNSGGFNPLLPLANALVANDDFGGPNSGFTYNFTTTGTYYLVMCSFKNDVTGPYSVSVSAAVPLPLKLVSFTAGKAGTSSNIINWSSAEESNLTNYQLQRSNDNRVFVNMANGSIAAKNNSTLSNYSFMDKTPAKGYNYYRLKINETNGTFNYSNIALVKNGGFDISNLKVYPNPVSDYLFVEGKSMQSNKAFVSIINTGGGIMQSSQLAFNNQGTLSIDIKKLPAGKYFLKTVVDKEEAVLSFIKK
ncbi:MAG: T9SS type A sorting domain-containing protein [Ferruginibacter sp.]